MALLPAKFQNTDDMPMSLGKAIARAIAPRKIDPIEAFNKGDHGAPKWIGYDMAVSGSEKTFLAKYSVSGNTVTISGLVEFSAAPSVQKFKVGDRVRPNYARGITPSWSSGVVTLVEECYSFVRVIYRVEGTDSLSCDNAKSLELIPAPEPAATPVALGDGWIEWKGGPVPNTSARMDIKFEDGVRFVNLFAGSVNSECWTYKEMPGGNRVIAYKVVA